MRHQGAKNSQTEKNKKIETNFLPMKGAKFISSVLCSHFSWLKYDGQSKKYQFSEALDIYELFMDDETEHKVNDLDVEWELDSE